jgi:hypothetical protein
MGLSMLQKEKQRWADEEEGKEARDQYFISCAKDEEAGGGSHLSWQAMALARIARCGPSLGGVLGHHSWPTLWAERVPSGEQEAWTHEPRHPALVLLSWPISALLSRCDPRRTPPDLGQTLSHGSITPTFATEEEGSKM